MINESRLIETEPMLVEWSNHPYCDSSALVNHQDSCKFMFFDVKMWKNKKFKVQTTFHFFLDSTFFRPQKVDILGNGNFRESGDFAKLEISEKCRFWKVDILKFGQLFIFF